MYTTLEDEGIYGNVLGPSLSFPSLILFFIVLLFVFVGGLHPDVLKTYSWLCAHGPFLAVLKELYRLLMIRPESVACKASALPTVLTLWPKHHFFVEFLPD